MKHQWRHILILLAAVGPLAGVMSLSPIAQDPAYHAFADQRTLLGLPHGIDVFTNLPFLMIGIAGLRLCLHSEVPAARRSWTVFFAGVALVGIGSAYYHVDPTDQTLVWDRLPMTAGFMGILMAVLSERVNERIEAFVLPPAILGGLTSVLWWVVLGDLRPYAAVQLMPLTVIPMVVLLYPGQRGADRAIMFSMALYVLAKVFEHYDHAIYAAMPRQVISGHSLKHLAAAAGCAAILIMIRRRSFVRRSSRANDQKKRPGIIADDTMSIAIRGQERKNRYERV